jgi:hypothetical protein
MRQTQPSARFERKSAADYRALARTLNIRWLGPLPPNVETKTHWQCPQGHHWQAAYHPLSRAKGCPACQHHVPKQPDDYHALAATRGYQWLGPQVRDTSTKTRWRCAEGHEWEAPFSTIQKGHGCPACAKHARKTAADYHALAKLSNFRWLGSTVPAVTDTKTRWACSRGHTWASSYHNLSLTKGCPICLGKRRKTDRDYRALARRRGLKWLGQTAPSNVGTKTRWACRRGHAWDTTYNSLQQGHGCPWCANRVQKSPKDYRALARTRGFQWLGPEVSRASAKTTWRCGKRHVWSAPYSTIQSGHGCPYCARRAPKTPADYHAMAQQRGYEWLGPAVPTAQTKTWWRCPFGHEWLTPYASLRSGYNCPHCNRARS